jgi:drug/metabolite transporter (DMT)-like permease
MPPIVVHRRDNDSQRSGTVTDPRAFATLQRIAVGGYATLVAMNTRQPLDQQAFALMLLLSLVWSFQQIALKGTASEASPMLQIAIRSGVGALLLGVYMRHRGESLPLGSGYWRPGMLVGLLFGLEYLFLGEALRLTSAAHAVVFLYTAPVFTALGLHWTHPSEKLRRLQWAGIVLAFAGIAVAFFPAGGLSPDGRLHWLWGDLLALLGGLAWGATTVAIRTTRLSQMPATQTLMYQLLGAFVLLAPASWVLGHTTFEPSPLIWAALAYQCIIMSFFSFLLWFWLLTRYFAAQLSVLTFMTPLITVFLGACLLGEAIEPRFLAGTVLVVGGIVLVTSPHQAFRRVEKGS